MMPASSESFRRLCSAEAFCDPRHPDYELLRRDYPYIPLESAGIPTPGLDFQLVAEAMVSSGSVPEVVNMSAALNWLHVRALYDDHFSLPILSRGQMTSAEFIPGHMWDPNVRPGPHQSDIMLVSKMPGIDEARCRRNWSGNSGQELRDALAQLRADPRKCYVANLVRFPHLDPKGGSILRRWLDDCKPLLFQEIQLVRPKFILLIGSDPIPVFMGAKVSQKSMLGRSFDYQYPDYSNPGAMLTARLMVVSHPARILRQPELRRPMVQAIGEFFDMAEGRREPGACPDVDHRVVTTASELRATLAEIFSDPSGNRVIAVDGEWHGADPGEPGAYLRTIQISWRPYRASCIRLRHAGGAPAFLDDSVVADPLAALPYLQLLLKRSSIWSPRIVGHGLNADLPWLAHFGLDLAAEFAEPEDDANPDGVTRLFGWQKAAREGGFDTMLAAHACDETADFELESLATANVQCPRYDGKLNDWKKVEERRLRAVDKDLSIDGYGDVPEEVINGEPTGELTPAGQPVKDSYSNFDADATRRLFDFYNGEPGRLGFLDSDRQGNSSRLPFHTSRLAQPAFREMHETGILVDRPLAAQLSDSFLDARRRIVDDIKDMLRWPTFNPNSVDQCKEMLFGECYNKMDRLTGTRKMLRPDGAVTLGLKPYKTTGKRSKLWDEVAERGQTHLYDPSTDKEALAQLQAQHPIAGMLRDTRTLSAMLGRVLRPGRGVLAGAAEVDETGDRIYDKGFLSYVQSDGRVRSLFWQTKETGRSSSSAPPLQNLAKKKEKDYRRILADNYVAPIRSMLRAGEGRVLVSADWTGAELLGIAVQSGDPGMIDHCLRSYLPESDDRHYDIHAAVAIRAFSIHLPDGSAPRASKSGLKDAGQSGMRDGAKCVAAGTRILTDLGWLPVEVFSGAAMGVTSPAVSATAASDVGPQDIVAAVKTGPQKCLKISAEGGYRLVCTRDHHLRVIDKRGRYAWRSASRLRVDDWVCVWRGQVDVLGDDTFPSIPNAGVTSFKPIDYPAKFDEAWAAFFGLYVAEGSVTDGSIHVSLSYSEDGAVEAADLVMAAVFGDRLSRYEIPSRDGYKPQRRWSVHAVHLARWMAQVAGQCSSELRVPEFVFRWPSQLQVVFLRWLFEGDGSAKERASGGSPNIHHSTSSEQLAQGVQLLLCGLGVTTNLNPERRAGYGGTYWDLYVAGRVSQQRFVDAVGFVTSRKNSKCEEFAKTFTDLREVPHQLRHLRLLMPSLRGIPLEKCRECLRDKTRIRLNTSRLGRILGGLDLAKLSPRQLKSYRHLKDLLDLPVVFRKVTGISDAGVRETFDVEVSGNHTVVYDGFVTHQCVVFGAMYGAGPATSMRRAWEEGNHITLEEAEGLSNALDELYPGVPEYFANCRSRVDRPGWMRSAYGRLRRAPVCTDRTSKSEMERQFMNMAAQGLVADAMNLAMWNLRRFRELAGDRGRLDRWFDIVLMVHDQIVLEVPIPAVEWVYDEVLPACMEKQVTLRRCDLDGNVRDPTPFHFRIDREVEERWGAEVTQERAAEIGLPLRFAAEPKKPKV